MYLYYDSSKHERMYMIKIYESMSCTYTYIQWIYSHIQCILICCYLFICIQCTIWSIYIYALLEVWACMHVFVFGAVCAEKVLRLSTGEVCAEKVPRSSTGTVKVPRSSTGVFVYKHVPARAYIPNSCKGCNRFVYVNISTVTWHCIHIRNVYHNAFIYEMKHTYAMIHR